MGDPWTRIEVRVREDFIDPAGIAAQRDLKLAGLVATSVRVHRVFFVLGADTSAEALFVDPVLEESSTQEPLTGLGTAVSVWKQPGVMDPSEASILRALRVLGHDPARAVTGQTYWIESGALPEVVLAAVKESLANEVIEEIGPGAVPQPRDLPGDSARVALPVIPLSGLSDQELLDISRRHVLALDVEEMRAVRDHFAGLSRDPRLGELETVAQTWSEHCKHKTLTGPIDFTENGATERIGNLLKESVFASTVKLDKDWCVSVFKDNAGIVRFDDENDICFKVETHNHPSAIEPYGGAGTGTGGVIRDILGTGLAARPIANTDVFCFGDLDTRELPKGVLHPLRVMKGVVAGVRDYGNRMGIPTVNGAVCFDPRYLGNPIVYCGTVGIIPRGMSEKAARPGDRIVAVGGRTGRDGIHGATFSSEALHDESDVVSGGAVQIGNPIEEKRVLDTLLQARDRGLFTALTDCGAGGFSSAVGEMAEECGAEVWLERAPLKYRGLNPVEIWISEAQERMVLAVPPEHEAELLAIFQAEDVEAVVIGEFTGDGRLLVKHLDEVIVDLTMEFLHNGLPKTPRTASWTPPAIPPKLPPADPRAHLLGMLADGDVCSKEWIVRQYDHEVQAGSAIKPLVGPEGRGPGDASVVVPVLGKKRGVVIGCGIDPRHGDLDPYEMAMCAVDEAIRNVVAVGADPDRIAILDNFSWGDCKRPEVLGAMVKACRGCHDAALLFSTPFISGKDSLNNEFRHKGESIAIPHTLLISAMGQIEDVTRCVTSDAKRAGNKLLLIGETNHDPVPTVHKTAPATMRAVARLIRKGQARAVHDLSHGGLAVAAAEMAMGGGLGIRLDTGIDLFNESPSRFLVEVEDRVLARLKEETAAEVIGREVGATLLQIGEVVGEVIEEPVLDFKTFQVPLQEARDAFFTWENLL